MEFPCTVDGFYCETFADYLDAHAGDDRKYWDPTHPEYEGDEPENDSSFDEDDEYEYFHRDDWGDTAW